MGHVSENAVEKKDVSKYNRFTTDFTIIAQMQSIDIPVIAVKCHMTNVNFLLTFSFDY